MGPHAYSLQLLFLTDLAIAISSAIRETLSPFPADRLTSNRHDWIRIKLVSGVCLTKCLIWPPLLETSPVLRRICEFGRGRYMARRRRDDQFASELPSRIGLWDF